MGSKLLGNEWRNEVGNLEIAVLKCFDVLDSLTLGEGVHAEHKTADDGGAWDKRTHHQGEGSHVHVAEGSETESTETLDFSIVEHLLLEDLAIKTAGVGELIEVVDAVDLVNEVAVGLGEPLQVAALHREGELLVLVDRAVAYLVHLVKLAFEEHEVTACLRLLVNHVHFKLLESVDDLKEVTVVEEEAKVTLLSLLDDLLNGDHKRILVEIIL